MTIAEKAAERAGALAVRLTDAQRRIAALEAALGQVMIGGNHLATVIECDHPPAGASHKLALTHYGPGDKYEAWCCWQTIMAARCVLEAKQG